MRDTKMPSMSLSLANPGCFRAKAICCSFRQQNLSLISLSSKPSFNISPKLIIINSHHNSPLSETKNINNNNNNNNKNNDHQKTLPLETKPNHKNSFAIATGEMFLGIASKIIRTRSGMSVEVPLMFRETEETERQKERDWERFLWRRKEVAKEVVDPAGVVWEQSDRDVEAERERKVMTSPGFSFSAAGLLFPYHLGVAHFLIEKGYIKDTTPLAGASAGAIVCAVIASGSSMQEALRVTKVLAEDCRTKGTAFRLGAVLRDILVDFLPDDVHIRSNGRVRVAVTQLLWKPRGLLVDQFDSKEDLINAVFTSSFIPGYLAPRPATMFRNRLCIDGGLTLFMPPTSAAQTVRVCAFPTSQLGLEGIGISPDCIPLNRATPRELFNWALEPAEDLILDRLFELGYLDAEVWGNNNPVEDIVKDESLSSGSGAIA